MKYFEYGRENPELLIILHGGGVCYRGAAPTAKRLAEVYHVIIAAYDGFNPDEPETEFKSVRYEAEKLGDYISENYGGKIDILYGISFGCFVLMDVLADKRLSIATTIADGMPTMDYPNIKNKLLCNLFLLFLTGSAYLLIGKAGPLRRKIVCAMTKRSEESFECAVYRNATWKSWINEDKCMIGRRKDFSLFGRTDMYIWHGADGITEKKLAKHIAQWRENGYKFTYKLFPNMGHGALVGEHPELFLKEIEATHEKTLEKRRKGSAAQ